MGRTPLIKLSPKKTWEGFIGAFFSTMLFGLIVIFLFPLIHTTTLSFHPAAISCTGEV